MAKFLIAKHGIDGAYSEEVEGEELVIKGFEKIKLFIHEEDDFYDTYVVSELETGYSVVHSTNKITYKDEAIELAKFRLQKSGLDKTIEVINKMPKVKDLPVKKSKGKN